MKNSYFKALSGLFALCALLVGGGCDDSDSEVNEKPYAISVSQNEMAAYYKIKAPTAAGAGETVSVEVEVTSENHYLKFVSANGVACEQVAGDTRGGTFEFVMPERDVTLGVIIQEFKPEEYPINAPVSQEYTVAVAKTAVAGEVVDVEIVVTNGMFAVSACLFNDTPCELVSSGTVTWKYRFTMPAEEVTLTVATDLERHLISLKQGEHTSLRMLNCCDDWEAVPPVFDECMYGIVKFMWSADLGYDGQVKITGQTTGNNIEYTYQTDDPDMGECWSCVMPDEPILIETSAVEKTDYVGKLFVGTYKGFQLTASKTQVIRGNSSEFSMELKTNTSYFVKSTDANRFDFDGCYEFDEAKNRFEYLAEFSDDGYGEMDFGAGGSWFEGGDAFVYINDLIDDKPDNVKYYFTSTADFEFVSAASDSYGSRYLIELNRAGAKSWYYSSVGPGAPGRSIWNSRRGRASVKIRRRRFPTRPPHCSVIRTIRRPEPPSSPCAAKRRGLTGPEAAADRNSRSTDSDTPSMAMRKALTRFRDRSSPSSPGRNGASLRSTCKR